MKLWGIAAVMVVVGVLVAGCTGQGNTSSDVTITGFRYGYSLDSGDTIPVLADGTIGSGFQIYGMLSYISTKNSLYMRVYDKGGNDITKSTRYGKSGGGVIDLIGYHLDNLNSPYEIKLCWTSNPKLGSYSNTERWDILATNSPTDVFCQSKLIDPPKFNVEVTPDTVTISLTLDPTKIGDSTCGSNIVAVTNKGDFRVYSLLEKRYQHDSNNPTGDIYFENSTGPGEAYLGTIEPGQSKDFKIRACDSNTNKNPKDLQTVNYVLINPSYNNTYSAQKIPISINVQVKKGV